MSMDIDARSFEAFRDLVYGRSGIVLGEGKQALVGSRIGKRMRQLGLTRFPEYLDWVKGKGGEEEMTLMLDAISTNVTSFFREPVHFEFLRARLEELLKTGRNRLRIWCAAASTGEEPYTLAMTVRECQPDPACDIKILATDISTRVLHAAKEGKYAKARIEALPPGFAQRYFDRVGGRDEPLWSARPELRALLRFARLNLATPPFPMRGPMDFIFCRNVMIYFDNPVRQRLLEEFHRLLAPGAFLIVGHSESLTGLTTGFQSVLPSVYRRVA
ncbi:MAG: protein-glutamate O-methyltransferase CheR [Fibrobacteres bacterium]|nr:protein-glutamate O-methyltransferase CheR [Fibrobacterota bacterium]